MRMKPQGEPNGSATVTSTTWKKRQRGRSGSTTATSRGRSDKTSAETDKRPATRAQRLDVEGWLVLDAREDGRMLVVCRDCQTAAERAGGRELSDGGGSSWNRSR
jgi:hypothetical protein